MLGVAFAGLLLVQVYGLSRVLGASESYAALMSFLAACAPAVTSLAPSGFVDIAYACYSVAALRVLLAADLTSGRAVTGGLFLGFALGIKYTAIPLVAITLVVGLLAHVRRLPAVALLRRETLVLTVAVLIGSPFYIKNFIALGSPIYPPPVLLTHWFHARAFPIAASNALESYVAQRGHGLGTGPLDLLLLPWRFSLHTELFHGAGGIGAAPLALGCVGALVAIRSRRQRGLLVWVALASLSWFVTDQEARFLINVVAISFAFAALGASWLGDQWPRVGKAAIAAVAIISAAYGLGSLIQQHREQLLAALSPAREARLRERDVPYLQAWRYLNSRPEVRCVLILDEFVPPYYLHTDYVKIRGMHGERPLEGVENASQALPRAGDLHVTHVLDVLPPEWAPHVGFQVEDVADLTRVFSTQNARIYRVKARVTGTRVCARIPN